MAENIETYAELLAELLDTNGVDQASAQRRKELQIKASTLWAQRIDEFLSEESTTTTT